VFFLGEVPLGQVVQDVEEVVVLLGAAQREVAARGGAEVAERSGTS
jgi:hypothetical protein